VVDDDEACACSIERFLKRAGYEVTVAGSVAEALRLVATAAFEVVLSDIGLPGESGVELLRRAHELDRDLPVVLMTGSPTVETAIEALTLGALQYLPKPATNDEVVAAVATAVRHHEQARQNVAARRVQEQRTKDMAERADLGAGLDRALERMWMAFQPIVRADRGGTFGFEALMRTTETSLPHPGAILSAAERLGRLVEVGRRVRALSAAALEAAPSGACLFVNLHVHDLLDEKLYDPNEPLARVADRVVLELTERAAADDVADLGGCVRRLRSAGYRIAIDDLGAGYAGLSSFAMLEPDVVKLDMSLVRGVHVSPVRQRLIRSLVSVCREMKIHVVAEGVEVAAERDAVVGLGCDLIQGYLFAKPGRPFPTVSAEAYGVGP
jgi:EAL domain-containing protein (putative c-di-GMP-specific phosphodiesterase class I)